MNMNPSPTRGTRFEIILAIALVALTATYARWVAIPSFASRHVQAAEDKYDFDVGEPNEWFTAWSIGDGQAYVLIALDPAGGKLEEEIPEAGYRFTRAAFGWAGWLFSFGEPNLVPLALGLVSLFALVANVVVATRLRGSIGPRAWLLLLNPALYIAFSADTGETLAVLFLTLSLAYGSTLAAALVGVTRPSFLVSMIGRWRELGAGLLAAGALAAYGMLRFGLDSVLTAGGRLGRPVAAYVEYPTWQGWLLAALAAGTLVLGLTRKDVTFVAAGAFVLCFAPDVLRDPMNAWRAAGFLPVLWALGPGYVGTRVREPRLVAEGKVTTS